MRLPVFQQLNFLTYKTFLPSANFISDYYKQALLLTPLVLVNLRTAKLLGIGSPSNTKRNSSKTRSITPASGIMYTAAILFLLQSQLMAFARADFWIYVENEGGARVYKFMDQIMSDCDKIQESVEYYRFNDVSGNKKGFRSVGADELDPDVLEFNVDFGHYSESHLYRYIVVTNVFAAIYKDRGSAMVDLRDEVKGQCYLRNTNTYECKSCWLCWDNGNSIYRCDTKVGTEGNKLQLSNQGNYSAPAADA